MTNSNEYKEALHFLMNQLPVFHRDGKQAYKANLSNSIALDNYLCYPHKKYKTIHVGGTNGKGSVSHMIASVLQEAGFKTGLYTSPHLVDFRERIKINGQMISESAVSAFVTNHKKFIKTLNPSFFELTTAMAFDYFATEHVDVAIIEVGLGGRLDCTNIISPILTVITNIGLDHTDILGNTLELIAREKSGIIKTGIPAVIGQTQMEIKHIFDIRSEVIEAPIYFADKILEVKNVQLTDDSSLQIFEIFEYYKPYLKELKLDLIGKYQQKNIVTAIKALQILKEQLHFDFKNIYTGLTNVKENTGLKGRWQIISRNPFTIIDTAHNPDGIRIVIEQIKNISSNKTHIIIGFANDKDIKAILQLLPVDAIYYFTKSQLPRSLNEKELAAAAFNLGLNGLPYDNVNTALAAARKNVTDQDIILITGSNYVLGELNELNV